MDHGRSVFKLLDTVDVTKARKLLDNLDAIDIENILKLDDGIIKNLADLDSVAIKGFSGKFGAIVDLGEDAVKQINDNGIELIPFLTEYGLDGVDFVKNNTEAAEFVLKHWNDAPENVALAMDYGKPAMDLLDAVDNIKAKNLDIDFGDVQRTAEKILENDGLYNSLMKQTDALESVFKASPEAIDRLVANNIGAIQLVDAGDIDRLEGVMDGTLQIVNYKTTSGTILVSTPGKTTTILGNFNDDTKAILKELNVPKSTDFSGNPGGFNLLNTPDDLFTKLGEDGFWDLYNEPFLNEVINRGDEILMATPLTDDYLYRIDLITGKKRRSGYGKEYDYLVDHGYDYIDGKMIKVRNK
jgi:CheY-like chemotaxis protein